MERQTEANGERVLVAAAEDERALVAMAQAGLAEAVEALYRIYNSTLRRIAWRYRGVSFEDALQEARLVFWICVCSYDEHRHVDFGAYVWRKVRGDVRSRMRRLWTLAQRNVYADATPDDANWSFWDALSASHSERDPVGDSHERNLRRLLDAAKLSPRERLAIEAGLWGFSMIELAQAEGVSFETVKTWRKRALAKLRRCAEEG